MGKYTPGGKEERETGRDGEYTRALVRSRREERAGWRGWRDRHRKMDKWANGPSESRRREMTTERLSKKPTAPSQLLPWIFGQQVRHLQLQRDEGTLCPGLSGRGPQLLLEAAPQDCPPSCGVPGSCLPGLPVGGQSGLPCWSLGAEGSQETSGKDPGSSPERGKRKHPVTGAGRLGQPRVRYQDGGHPQIWGSGEGSQVSALSSSLISSVHPGVGLTTSTATFSFSRERPFRGPVTATPSSSAFLRSSSIS